MSNTIPNKGPIKITLIIVLIVALFTTAVLYYGIVKPYHTKQALHALKIDGTILPEATPIQAFHFTDQYNAPFTVKNLLGHWTFLFFGFTNCGMVCPTTLTELNKMISILQQALPAEQLPQVVLVSVDPERDGTTRLRDYVKVFNDRFIAIRADREETESFEQQLHITAIKVQAAGQPNDRYMINHTAEILLINPDGKIQAYLSYPHKAAQMAKDYKNIINIIG